MHASITTKSTSLHNMSCFVDVVELDVVGFGNGEEECHQVLLQITAGDWLTATISLGLRLEVAIRCEYDNTRNKFKDAMVTGHEKKKRSKWPIVGHEWARQPGTEGSADLVTFISWLSFHGLAIASERDQSHNMRVKR